jgi:hypothetical protein
MQKAISWFSCGAASAIATVLASIKYGAGLEVVYCRVVEEHPDNLKFIEEFTAATGIPVIITMNEKYGGSIYNVFEHRKFLKGPHGAQCTGLLKKQVRKAYKPTEQYDWVHVFGYTVDEKHRAERFIQQNVEVTPDFLLLENGITKADCFRYLKTLGLDLPMMYKLGYTNNNCIGCVKGGMGYWNKIRVDFPGHFITMMLLERRLGHAILKDKDGPVYLDELDPNRGVFKTDAPGDCGFTCEAGAAVPFIIDSKRDTRYIDLPWVTPDE